MRHENPADIHFPAEPEYHHSRRVTFAILGIGSLAAKKKTPQKNVRFIN